MIHCTDLFEQTNSLYVYLIEQMDLHYAKLSIKLINNDQV